MMQRCCFFLFSLVWLTMLIFGEEDLQIRVQQLEMQVKELTEEVLRLRKATQVQEKVTEKLTAARYSREVNLYDELIQSFQKEAAENDLYTFYRDLIHSHIWLGGYLSVQMEQRESLSEESALDLSSLGLQFRSALNERFSAEGEFKISNPEKIEIAHGYLLASLDPWINFKIGVIRIPLGRYNSIYSIPSQALGALPMFYQTFVPVVWSEPGLSFFGKIEETLPFPIVYEAMVSNGLGEGSFQTDEGNRKGKQDFHQDNNTSKQVSMRLGILPRNVGDIVSSYLGISGLLGKYDRQNENEYWAMACDFFFRVGPFTLIGDHDTMELSGEYIRFEAEVDRAILTKYPKTASHMESFYLEWSYLFFPESWREWDILFGDESTFAITMRYEKIQVRAMSQVNPWKDASLYTLGIQVRPISETVFRLEYSWIEEFWNGKNAWNNRFLASFATYF